MWLTGYMSWAVLSVLMHLPLCKADPSQRLAGRSKLADKNNGEHTTKVSLTNESVVKDNLPKIEPPTSGEEPAASPKPTYGIIRIGTVYI